MTGVLHKRRPMRKSWGTPLVSAPGQRTVLEPMKTRAEAFGGPFPAGPDWAAQARSRLGMDGGDDQLLVAVCQGWMRLGSTRDATLVDTLFVLTADRLGFGQTRFETTDPNWVDLSAVHAIDLIEGVPYPLDAVEVQFVGGLAIFVGWPEEFTNAVLSVLRVNGALPAMAPLFEPDASMPTFDDTVDAEPSPAALDIQPLGPMLDDALAHPVLSSDMFAVAEPDAQDDAPIPDIFSTEGLPAGAQSEDQLSAEQAFFGHLEADQESDADDDYQGDDTELPTIPESAEEVTGPWDDPAIAWPDAFRDSAFLGGHPIHQRRRKTCTVLLERRGLVAATSRTGGWHLHIPWHAVTRLDVQGADEIKFTHNQRVNSDGSVLVADLADGTTLLFEIRAKRPATLRAAVAPIKDVIDGV
jgi:hypothetical protein